MVKLWKYQEGIYTHMGLGHAGAVTCCRFSPDARFIVSCCAAGSIIVWRVPEQGDTDTTWGWGTGPSSCGACPRYVRLYEALMAAGGHPHHMGLGHGPVIVWRVPEQGDTDTTWGWGTGPSSCGARPRYVGLYEALMAAGGHPHHMELGHGPVIVWRVPE
ncbi:hypothetical protein evm_014849, partial [Chilo suppressalis]